MAPLAATLAVALAFLAAVAPAALAAQCKEVPTVPGVDQSPSDPNAYGERVFGPPAAPLQPPRRLAPLGPPAVARLWAAY
jgi:hypothetical protein